MRAKCLLIALVLGFGLVLATSLALASGREVAAAPRLGGESRDSWLAGRSAEALSQVLGEPQLDRSVFIRQTDKITATDGMTNARFAYAVAVDGDTAVVGAYSHGSETGAAYLFQRNHGGADKWGQVAVMTAAGGVAGDAFGFAVAIDGDRVVVGAKGVDAEAGAAYVFERNEGGADGWGQTRVIKAANSVAGDGFGVAVAIDGDTIAVGAHGVATETGVAYVFSRNAGGADNWQQTDEITAADGDTDHYFGQALALDDDTLVVGAMGADGAAAYAGAAYIFARNEGGADSWGQAAKVTAADGVAADVFGWSVAADGGLIAVGAPQSDGQWDDSGSVYLYSRNQGGADNWGQMAKITATDYMTESFLGASLALDGHTLLAGAPGDDRAGLGSGAAYVFGRNEAGTDGWGQTAKLTAGDGAADDSYGFALAVDGRTILIGAYMDDDNGSASGSAYVLTRSGATWEEESEPSPDDTQSGDRYGYSLDLEGDMLVVGAPRDDPHDFRSGSASIFTRNEGGASSWGQTAHISAADGAALDYFGWSVATDGDTIAVGACQGDGAQADSGAVYLFERNDGGADSWGMTKKITATDGADGDYFGASVAVGGGLLVVGAPEDDDGCPPSSDCDSGSVYLYSRNEGGADSWGLVLKITTTDSITNDLFGSAVAIDGDTIVVGANSDDENALNAGSAYVFSRNEGGADAWGLTAHISPTDAAAIDFFGMSVDIDGSTIVVGATSEDGPDWALPNINFNCGALYVFACNEGGADGWGQLAKLTVTDAFTNDQLGSSVAIDGDTIVAGARYRDEGAESTGAAYVFSRNNGGADNWGLVAKLIAPVRTDYDYFGDAAAVCGDVIAVGAWGSDVVRPGGGLTYLYRESLYRVYLPLVLRNY